MRHRFGTQAADRLVEPMVGAILADDPDLVSLQAIAPHLSSPSSHPRKPGGPPVFSTIRGGLSRLPESIQADLRHGEIRTRAPVRALRETATRACALACVHCRAEAIPDRSPFELTHDEGRRLLDEIASFGPPSPLLVLTGGGDPFERPDLEQLITEATQRGIPVSLAPSVTPLLTLDALRRLRASGVRAVSLSLDGASSAVHDGFRGIPGVFDRTLQAARWVREAGCKLQVNTTVTAQSLPELADVLAIVLELDTTLWSVFLLVPTGRGEAIALPSAEETEDLLHFLHDAGQHISVKATEAPHFRRVVAERGQGRGTATGPVYRRLRERLDELLPAPPRETVRRPPLDVNAGRGFVFVSHTGVVQPSGFFPLAAGSVRERSLPEIYRHSPLLRALRDPARLRGACGACAYAETCGGSRSRAYAVSGDPFVDEPTCILAMSPSRGSL